MEGQKAWELTCQQLQLQFDKNSYDTWIRGSFLIEISDEGEFVIGVRNAYVRDMLRHRLYRNVRRALSDVLGNPTELQFEIKQVEKPKPEPAPEEEMPLFRLNKAQPRPELPLHELIATPKPKRAEGVPLSPHLTFERFIPSDTNRITYEAALAVADRPGYNYNPFMVYGGVGLGKTHILQAIAHRCEDLGLSVIYTPAEIFTNDLIHAIRTNTGQLFRDRYREADVLLLDDIQFIIGKDGTQEEFFHTFDVLYRFNKQIVLASDRHPRDFIDLADRLRSRFEGGLVTDVQPLSYEARLAIVEMWTVERNITIERPVQEMIAKRAYHNVRELEGIFNQVLAETRIKKSTLSLTSATEVVGRYDRPRNHLKKASAQDILLTTAEYFNLTPDDLRGESRISRIQQARQVAIYLMREMTDHSLKQIGVMLGRNHSTVIHSINKIEEEAKASVEMKELLDRIRGKLSV